MSLYYLDAVHNGEVRVTKNCDFRQVHYRQEAAECLFSSTGMYFGKYQDCRNQCGPSVIPDFGVICGFSLLVLVLAPRGVSLCITVFPSPQIPNFPFDLSSVSNYHLNALTLN